MSPPVRSDDLTKLADAIRHGYWNAELGQITSWERINSKAKEEWLRAARAALRALRAYPPTPVQGTPGAAAGGAAVQSEPTLAGRGAGCAARRHSDSIVCERCRMRWDAGDPMPPNCLYPNPPQGEER